MTIDGEAQALLTRYQAIEEGPDSHRWTDPLYQLGEMDLWQLAAQFSDCALAVQNALAIKARQRAVQGEVVQDPSALMTLAEASKLLGLGAATLRTQVGRGRLQAHQFGKTWVTTAAEVERYRQENKGKRGRPRGS